jgi:hypothetical protein
MLGSGTTTGSGSGRSVTSSFSTGFSGTGKVGLGGRSATAGLEGALFPLVLGLDGGTMMEDRSWLEMAADRR